MGLFFINHQENSQEKESPSNNNKAKSKGNLFHKLQVIVPSSSALHNMNQFFKVVYFFLQKKMESDRNAYFIN